MKSNKNKSYIETNNLVRFKIMSTKININTNTNTMSVQITDEIRSKSEFYKGDDKLCQQKSRELLEEIGMPNGLLPLQDIEECGYLRETGFVWLKQKKSITHKFDKINRVCTYATEVTATVENKKIKKLTGVKAKELLLWLSISDIFIDEKAGDKITFKAPSGLSRTFPVDAFVIEEEKKKVVDGVKGNKGAGVVPV